MKKTKRHTIFIPDDLSYVLHNTKDREGRDFNISKICAEELWREVERIKLQDKEGKF